MSAIRIPTNQWNSNFNRLQMTALNEYLGLVFLGYKIYYYYYTKLWLTIKNNTKKQMKS
jgi:hypothetical protein